MSAVSTPEPLSRITFTWKGKEFDGILISIVKDKMNIKLSSGYNILVKPENMKVVGKIKPPAQRIVKESAGSGTPISLIATGGTIVSKVDYSTGAVFPSMDIEELTSKFRYLTERRNIKNMIFPIYSAKTWNLINGSIWQKSRRNS
jgi:L-asparaginase/archaeal Glu-tRNAGln amidotransferase subunit D